MSVFVATNVSAKVNGVDLSDHVTKVQIQDMRDKLDITAMGATNKVYTKGLGDATITLDFLNDFAAGEIYATLQPLIGSSTPVTVEIIPVKGTGVSATNPRITLSATLFEFDAVNAQVGQPSTLTAAFINASQTGLTYATV